MMLPFIRFTKLGLILLCSCLLKAQEFTKKEVTYQPPGVELVDRNGGKVSLPKLLKHDGPVLVQFIFTSCPTICPALSATFAEARKSLGEDTKKMLFVSVSIDPEHDTPARLKTYAKQFNADKGWRFLTGKREEIISVQKAFAVYQANKMWHLPVTLIRKPSDQSWLRLEGIANASDLANECRKILEEPVK